MRGMKKILPYLLFLFYVLVRYYLLDLLSLPSYSSLLFEVLFALTCIIIYWEGIDFINFFFDKRLFFIYFLLGGICLATARFNQWSIPFDFQEPSLFFHMVLLGPVVEELLFRLGFWKLIENMPLRFKYDHIILTSLFFSASHFYAYYLVPDNFKTFVLFQTLYTLFIGVMWALDFYQRRSYTTLVALHMSFNLGFFLTHFWSYLA